MVFLSSALLVLLSAAPSVGPTPEADGGASAVLPLGAVRAQTLPWVDLRLEGDPLKRDLSSHGITASGYTDDHKVFILIKALPGGNTHTVMSAEDGSAAYVSGPALIQVGSSDGSRVFDVPAGLQMICIASKLKAQCISSPDPLAEMDGSGALTGRSG